MYCVQCGVELEKGTKVCPLCGTKVLLPEEDLASYENESAADREEERLYPPGSPAEQQVTRTGAALILTFIFVIPMLICLLVDLNLFHGITFSGYVIAGGLALYVCICLPLWFSYPNPVIFVPVGAAALLLCALYVDVKTGGHWFLSFAFPAGGALLVIVETVVVLFRYAVGPWVHRKLFILGGASMGLGGLCLLVEFLLKVTFGVPMTLWSLYPLTVLFLTGLLMIIVGISRPLRRSLYKKLFL